MAVSAYCHWAEVLLISSHFGNTMEAWAWPMPNTFALGTGHAHASIVFEVRWNQQYWGSLDNTVYWEIFAESNFHESVKNKVWTI